MSQEGHSCASSLTSSFRTDVKHISAWSAPATMTLSSSTLIPDSRSLHIAKHCLRLGRIMCISSTYLQAPLTRVRTLCCGHLNDGHLEAVHDGLEELWAKASISAHFCRTTTGRDMKAVGFREPDSCPITDHSLGPPRRIELLMLAA